MNETDEKRENEQETETESGGKKKSRFTKLLIAAAAALFSGAGATVVGILLQAAVDRLPAPSPADPGTVVSETGKLSMSRNSFLRAIEAASGEECVYDYYGFFDDDADCEMYALVGTAAGEDEGDYLKARLWFANTDGVQEVIPDQAEYDPSTEVVTLKGRQFLILYQWVRDELVACVWGVYEGQPYETNLSGRGNGFAVNAEYDELEVTENLYNEEFYTDGGETVTTENCWQNYYFDFDGRNFKEYGGIPISIEDLKRLPGVESVLSQVDQSRIQTIFYRGNGVINMNYVYDFGYEDGWYEIGEYITMRFLNFRYRDGRIGMITNDGARTPNTVIWDLNAFQENPGDFWGDGFYQSALCPDVAVYPAFLPE